jgi:short subunit dehydrogenase-like uncharacterized protein
MEIWILGALGRTGRGITADLAARGLPVVLVGRDRERLERAAGGARVVVADGAEAMAAEIRRQGPAVVVNTIGGYAGSAVTIARACLPGGHYIDLAADLVSVPRLLDLHEEALAGGSTFVTGAGFGVLATEAVVVKLCEGRPAPSAVRVDALASYASEGGQVGTAFAASIVDVLTTGGRTYRNGRLVPARLGADPQTLVLPGGETAKSASVPSGELVAAQRASGAPSVVATSALAPASPAVRAVLPLLGRVLSVPVVRRFAVRRLAGITTKAAPRPREHSWGHAVVTWPDGTTREGWLRAGDAMDFTTAVAAEIAARLARGEGKPGAHTPTPAVGADVAEAAGGTFLR